MEKKKNQNISFAQLHRPAKNVGAVGIYTMIMVWICLSSDSYPKDGKGSGSYSYYNVWLFCLNNKKKSNIKTLYFRFFDDVLKLIRFSKDKSNYSFSRIFNIVSMHMLP